MIGDENDPRIVGHDVTNGNEEGGRTAMENLLQKDPDINVVYTINEPAAAGAYEALKAVGREKDVLIVSVDGGCPGVKNVAAGVIGATSQQYPLQMAVAGHRGDQELRRYGEKPRTTEGKDFFDTGVTLDHRQAGRGRRRRSPPPRASSSAGADAGSPCSHRGGPWGPPRPEAAGGAGPPAIGGVHRWPMRRPSHPRNSRRS